MNKNYFSRKNSDELLDRLFYVESFKVEGYKVFLNQLLEQDNIEENIAEEKFFEILKSFIDCYYKYKLLTKKLVGNLSTNLYETFLAKVYIPYRKLMIFDRFMDYPIINICDLKKEDIDYDYYEFLSYLMEGCSFIYCTLKRKNKFKAIVKYLEDYFTEKKEIDKSIKENYNLQSNFMVNFIANKILEIDNE